MSPPRFCPPRRLRSTRAFTLSELLVALAIAAVLAMVLLGAFSMVAQSGASVRCAGNLRNIGAALAMYVAENRGALPPMSALENPADSGSKVLTGQDALAAYLRMETPFNWRQNTESPSAFSVWICPADRELRPSKVGPSLPRWKAMNSYLLNYYIGKGVVKADGGNQNRRTVLRITEIANPHEVLYYADGLRADGGQGRMTEELAANAGVAREGADGLRFRHRERLHGLAVAGNVLSLTAEEVRAQSQKYTVPLKYETP